MTQSYPLDHGPSYFDKSTGERKLWRHPHSPVEGVALESERLLVAKAVIECRLDWYLDRMLITDRQHEAGTRIRHLWLRAIMPPSTTGSYGPAISGGGDTCDTALARTRLANALIDARLAFRDRSAPQMMVILISGVQRFPDKLPMRLYPDGHIVLAVCGFDEWAGGARRLQQLRGGLTALADYWELEK